MSNIDVDMAAAMESLDDVGVFLMLGRGDCSGVFQLDSYGGKKTIRAMRPHEFEDIVDAIALDRPGPMESGALNDYFARRNSKTAWQPHEIPEVEEILKSTYGVLIYQEQAMQVAQAIAGFTPGESDEMRAAIGKKKPEAMRALRSKFVEGVVRYLEDA